MSPILQSIANGSARGYGAFFGAAAATSFESIATVTVGSGGAANVTFSSIGTDWTHLQLRAFGQTNRDTYGFDAMYVEFNSDTSDNNYTRHGITGDGSSVSAFGYGTGQASNRVQFCWDLGTTTGSTWGAGIIDILDYRNTNKYKTIRSFGGCDVNGTVGGAGGNVGFGSNLWVNTNAITSIKLTPFVGTTISQYSHFALYGIKGAA